MNAWQLFARSPERIAARDGAHDGELRQIDAGRGQRRRVREVGRREPHHALSRPGQRGKRRQRERELADAFMVAKELGENPGGPPAAGQRAVEIRISR